MTPAEGDWEEINKKSSQKYHQAAAAKQFKLPSGGGRGGRGTDGTVGGRGRSAARGGAAGREGRGRDGRGRGRTGEPRGSATVPHTTKAVVPPEETPPSTNTDAAAAAAAVTVEDAASPPIRAPQGAWAAKKTEAEPSTVANSNRENVAPTTTIMEPPTMTEIARTPTTPVLPATVAPSPVTSKTNVWATKGSAHLIKAEKPAPPKPIVPPAAPLRKANHATGHNNGDRTRAAVAATTTTTLNLDVDVAAVTSVIPEKSFVMPPSTESVAVPSSLPSLSDVVPSVPASLTSGLNSSSLTSSTLTTSNAPAINAWNQDSQSNTVVQAVLPVSSVPEPKPTPVLNMGRWETEDNGANLDFGFGTFGSDNVTDDITDSHVVVDAAKAAANTAASPARPPPGLSMSGMPPMPTNAVLVHELENKLEEVSISKPQQQQVQDNPTSLSSFAPAHQTPYGAPPIHDSALSSPPLYGANPYSSVAGGMGMYGNYNASGVSGNAIPNHAFIPGGNNFGASQPSKAPIPQHQQQQPQPGLYNSAPTSVNVPSGAAGVAGVGSNDANTATNNLPTNASAPSTMPPGMAGGMPYGNQMYYPQQPFVMGQHQPNLGYSYGYGGQQFGGVQGGFGYPGGMHGNAGYGHGGPSYDDHTGVGGSTAHGNLPGSGAVGGLGGYDPQQQQPKNTGGYRGGGGGRHNNNQYQQYNAQQQHHQHGGYGGQPYGMGYHGDHFNQRGGYQNMQDPYSMQQQQQQGVGNYAGGGFQGDNQYKGKKNNRSGGLNQFQQPGPSVVNQNQHVPGQQQQQPFGLQGQSGVGSDSNPPGTDGWSNQNVGWSGGANSGWQPK